MGVGFCFKDCKKNRIIRYFFCFGVVSGVGKELGGVDEWVREG